MLNRNIFLAISVCLAGSVAALAQTPGQQYLFQYAGPSSGSGQLIGYNATGSSLSPLTSIGTAGPIGLEQVIAKPDGSKFYLVGTTGAAPLESVDSTFSNPHTIAGLSGPPTAVAITPDGKYLLAASTDQTGVSSVFVVDTASDQVTGSAIILPGAPNFFGTLGGFCAECWIAMSHDGQTAYVLTNSASGSSQISPINLSTLLRGNFITLPSGDATSISMSPLGQLYVTGGNALTQVNPKTLTVTGSAQLFFTPSQLRYTPDGTTAYCVNKIASSGGGSLMQIDLASLTAQTWAPNNAGQSLQFDYVLVAGNNRILAYTSAGSTLYDITVSPFSAAPSTLGSVVSNGQVSGQGISGAAITNELPSARYLYLLVANGTQPSLDRINLTTNTIDLNNGSPGLSSGLMQVVTIPSQGDAASFLTYNTTQNLAAGATSAPLIARVLDASGLPVYNAPAAFTTDSTTGLIINTPSSTTFAEGYAQTTVSNPTPSASCPSAACTVTLTVGSATTAFTLDVPTSSSGGGNGGGNGGGTASSQVTVYSGDGQVIQENAGTAQNNPLTVLVTDANGKPLPNVAVQFTVSSGPGAVDSCSTITPYGLCGLTDANGLASTDYRASAVQGGQAFQANTVTATTQYGSVNFSVVSYQGLIQPLALPIVPDVSGDIDLVQGVVATNAIEAQILSNSSLAANAPIVGAGIQIENVYDPTLPPPAKCQGSTLSDTTGVAHCNVIATCATGVGTFPINIDVGGGLRLIPANVTITEGGGSQLSIVSGNNQSGSPGNKLLALVAKITTACGTASSGTTVTWSVSPASAATLSAGTSTTDSSGQASVVVTLGQTTGNFQVIATAGGSKVIYKLSNAVAVTGMSIAGGNNQQATVGQAFSQPVVVQVTPAAAGIQVSFAVTSGSATLTPTTPVTTGANGQASVSVTAGATAGPIVITATALTFSATANLTSAPPGPSITAASFVNADSGAQGLVPCGRATVSGAGIAPTVQGALSGIAPLSGLPFTLGGLSLTVNGIAAPIESISNENGVQQATFQTPCEVAPGPGTVAVTVNGVQATPITGVQIYTAQPGIHSYVASNGKTYGYVIDAETGATITSSNLAHRGGSYYMIVTGLGQTSPAAVTDVAGSGQSVNINVQVIAGVDDLGVPVVSSQYLQGWNGFYVVKFTIPENAPTGVDQHLAIGTIVNGQLTFGNPVFIQGVQ